MVTTFSDQAAQNIRAVVRSYMHNLMLNETFPGNFTLSRGSGAELGLDSGVLNLTIFPFTLIQILWAFGS